MPHKLTPNIFTADAAGTGLQYLAAAAAGLRVVGRVDETILAVHKEREIVTFMGCGHLGDWHHTDGMTLQHNTAQSDLIAQR